MENEFRNEHGHCCRLHLHSNDFISVHFPRPCGLEGNSHVYYKCIKDKWIRYLPAVDRDGNGEWQQYINFSGEGQIRRAIKPQLTDADVTLLKLTMNGFTILTEPFTSELYETWIEEFYRDRQNRKELSGAA